MAAGPSTYPVSPIGHGFPSTDVVVELNCRDALSEEAQRALDSIRGEEAQMDLDAKVVCVGEMAVGKTSLLVRGCRDTFLDKYKSTISVDFMERHYKICGVPFSLYIWDTAGQERLRSASKAFYRGAKGSLVCYDVSNLASLKNIEVWHEEVKTNSQADGDEDFVSLLVGCKADLEKQVSPKKGKQMAEAIGAEWREVSAKEGTNVRELFDSMAVRLFESELIKGVQQRGPTQQQRSASVRIDERGGAGGGGSGSGGSGSTPNKRKKKCCGGSK